MHPECLLIGIGNEYRCDDGVGLIVARAIQAKNIPSLVVKELSGEGAALIDAWQGYEHVILADAVTSGAEPGTFIRMDAVKEKISSKIFISSTHAFGLASAVEVARSLKKLPCHLIILGIEGQDFSSGISLSAPVHQAMNTAIEKVLAEIHQLQGM